MEGHLQLRLDFVDFRTQQGIVVIGRCYGLILPRIKTECDYDADANQKAAENCQVCLEWREVC